MPSHTASAANLSYLRTIQGLLAKWENVRGTDDLSEEGFSGPRHAVAPEVAIIATLMSVIPFTPEQLTAARRTRGSVLVSAAAGSGKTAVLAERCAYLVCDAPPEDRCDVDEMVVLTFTDAAASEMRSRIVDAIRRRREASPQDARLRRQVILADAAQISTIHSFCFWLIRRWFNQLSLDPSSGLLDEHEMRLLRQEVLDALFLDWYAAGPPSRRPLGEIVAEGDVADGREEAISPARSFQRLVSDYGLGSDQEIAKFVLALYEFTASQCDPDAWLDRAVSRHFEDADSVLVERASDLSQELQTQRVHCEHLLATLDGSWEASRFYIEQIEWYAARLDDWSRQLGDTGRGCPDLARLEAVRVAIEACAFPSGRAPSVAKDADPALHAARDAAREGWDRIKKKLFPNRLSDPFARFAANECIEGLARTGPYVATLVSVLRSFREAYAARKREMNMLDFTDLERFAFELLSTAAGAGGSDGVTALLRHRFKYVLVDEFQDINPLQEAIISLASREPDSEGRNNLFVVGDVKQSIYRFRLAEPEIFNRRLRDHRASASGDSAIALQQNFRSRAEILDATNVIFRQLMRPGHGAIAYDSEAELRCGRVAEAASIRTPVEVHLLARLEGKGGSDAEGADEADDDGDDDGETRTTHWSDPNQWSPIEREAYLIGRRIHQWRAAGASLRFRDIAILLRTVRVNAERMATVLTMMGIPAYADAGGSLFAAREIRDVVSALEVLDNAQQDIPLAAVLRSGVLCEPLTDDDLAEIRCLDRDAAFHEVVRRYPLEGGDADRCERLAVALGRIDRYRQDARCRSVADLLWQLYEAEGFLGYVGGLPSGAQRRANLLKLHELARQFGAFRRQGLHRFLRFIHAQGDQDRGLGAAPAVGESDDVVRIMSIHHAKGLEFPAAFVAGLGTKFNFGDRDRRMIFERQAYIGLRVVDPRRMIQYPTIAHRRVAAEIERTAREEEMRILYVAMTRARDRLVLVGSTPNLLRAQSRLARTSGQDLPRLDVISAGCPLDWLLASLEAAPAGVVSTAGTKAGDATLFDVRGHDDQEIAAWRLGGGSDSQDEAVRAAAARCAPLPPGLGRASDDDSVEAVLAQTSFVYPHLASSSVRASVAASEMVVATPEADVSPLADRSLPRHLDRIEQRRVATNEDDFQIGAGRRVNRGEPNAAVQRGLATHRALECVDFSVATDESGVASELQRIEREGLLAAEDCRLVDQAALSWFVATPLAAAVRAVGNAYRREFMYIATEPLSCLDPSVLAPPEDRVLVRGVVDGILPVADGIDVIDFKTDAVGSRGVASRVARYRPQLTQYARAMSRIWRRPVRRCHLVFVSAREVFSWDHDGEKA